MKKLNIFILIFLLGFGYGCSGIQSRKTISDISDVSDETKAQVTIEDLEGQTVRTHVQNIDDNFDEIYALVDTGSASFTGMSGSVITSGTVSESYIDSSLTRTTAIDTAAELESVANLGAYASDILGCTNLAALMTLINGGAYSPTAALDFSGASSITSGPMAFSGTVTLPETPTDGQLTQYTGGAIDLFTFYNGSAWNYFVATNTAPSDDGYIPVYRTATGIGWEAQSGGGDVTASSTTTFTNKTIDANGTGNSITNIETDDISATTLITSSEIGTTATDAQVPTWKAVKDYLDSIIVSGNPTISITTPSADGTWVDSLTYTAFAGTAFDLQGISEIAWKLESEGTYATTGVSGTTNWTVSSITLSEGANELYARVTDTNANTAEDNLTINADITDPVGVADADGTHSGTGDSITSGIDWTETNLDTSTVACTVVNATPTSPTVTCVGNACDTETLTPDGEGTVTCTWNADDLAGNSATPIVQEFTYSVPSSTLGDTTVYTVAAAMSNTARHAFKLPVTTEAGTLDSISIGVACLADNTAKQFTCSLYSHDSVNDMPDSQVALMEEKLTGSVNNEVSVVTGAFLSGSQTLANATQYWVVVEFENNYGGIARGDYGDSAKIKYDTQTGITVYDWSAWGGTSSTTNSNYPYTVYINYH